MSQRGARYLWSVRWRSPTSSTLVPGARTLRPVGPTCAPGRPDMCARSARHVRSVGPTCAPGRPDMCARSTGQLGAGALRVGRVVPSRSRLARAAIAGEVRADHGQGRVDEPWRYPVPGRGGARVLVGAAVPAELHRHGERADPRRRRRLGIALR
jgi:hypothetical protein